MQHSPFKHDDELLTAKALLKSMGWTGPFGYKEKKITRWLHKLYYNPDGPPHLGTVFDLKNLACDCDLVYYGRNIGGDRSESLDPIVRHYLHRMREAMEAFVEWFWTNPEYEKWVNDGNSDEQILQQIVKVMVSYDVYPVWCDREGDERWKLMDLHAYARLREMRAFAIASEVGDKGTRMELMMKRFPRELPGKYHRPALPRDGSFIDLPRLGPGEGVLCPVEGCGLHFADSHSWKQHFSRQHPNFLPPEKRKAQSGLDALFDR